MIFQLKREVIGKAICVATNLFIQPLGRDAIQPGQIGVQHDPLSTYRMNLIFNSFVGTMSLRDSMSFSLLNSRSILRAFVWLFLVRWVTPFGLTHPTLIATSIAPT